MRVVRPVLRFVAAVLITSGILMFADAGLTVAWQEPISGLIASRAQAELGRELSRDRVQSEHDRRTTAALASQPKRIARLAALERSRLHAGAAIGRIELPALGRRYVVVQGTDTASLRKGPGHYPATAFPGQGGTVAIAGHRTTYLAPFRTIDKLKRGDQIVLDMPYARLTYVVETTRVVPANALWITHRVPGPERLVLSACHPLYSASHRIVAFARLVGEAPAS